MRFSRYLLIGALLAGACGPPPQPMNSTLTVAFAPKTASVADLTLSKATLVVSHVQPIGNAPPQNPPPPVMLTIDALSSTGASLPFDHPPPGLYSRVQFSVDDVEIDGTWRGTPVHAMVGMFGGNQVGLRAPSGHELDEGMSVTLTVDIDVGAWFAGDVLDGASMNGGQLECDMQSAPPCAGRLSMQIDQSFTLE
jgi:hypothetical protein